MRFCEFLLLKIILQYRLEQNSGLSHSRLGFFMKEKKKTVTLLTVMLPAQSFNITLIGFSDSLFFYMIKLEID